MDIYDENHEMCLICDTYMKNTTQNRYSRKQISAHNSSLHKKYKNPFHIFSRLLRGLPSPVTGCALERVTAKIMSPEISYQTDHYILPCSVGRMITIIVINDYVATYVAELMIMASTLSD